MRGSLLANKLIQRSSNFNSRLYMRGSLSQGTLSQSPPIFQVTPLHERQLTVLAYLLRIKRFQFTPLHERQLREFVDDSDFYDFNSRLYMRGSQGIRTRKRVHFKFQFTPLHERQPGGSAATAGRKDFNSRLYMRGSTECPQTGITACNFNSRLYMRGGLERQ